MPVLLRDSTAAAMQVVTGVSKTSKLQAVRALKDAVEWPRQHLVLVGGGHAHVQVIKALNWASRPKNLKVTLIDLQESASYSGMVPGCVSQFYTPEQTLLHLKPLAEWAGIEFIHDQVIDIDLDEKVVYTATNSPLPFDCISVDIGSTSQGLDDIPGAREFTVPTRPISKLVERIDRSMEAIEKDAAPRVVVIGGGVAGVELSMSLNGRFRSQCPKAQVTLLDSGTQLLPEESQRGRDALQRILQNQGIQVVHQCRADALAGDKIFASINGTPTILPCTHCIWATGAGSHPLARHLQSKGLDATAHGWIQVNEYLQSTSHPFLFAAGDCCHIGNIKNGSPPKAGVFAVRAGPVLIENLTRYLRQQQRDDDSNSTALKLQPYVPQSDFLKLLVCGDGRALGLRFGHAFYGKWVMDLKDNIDTNFMDLFRRENLPELSPENDSYDTSQYDAKMIGKTSMTPKEGAKLLSRTDDEVDYKEAWSVIRTMADDESYREQVLTVLESPHPTLTA